MSINNITTQILNELKNLLASETIIGKPTQVGDSIVMPLMKVMVGFGGGEGIGDKKTKKDAGQPATGGGGGGGITITPIAVLTITNGKAECFAVPQQQSQLGGLLDKIPDFLSSFKKSETEQKN